MPTIVLGEELLTRADFQTLARRRLKEAKVLLDNRCPEGAVYLAGYAVECALKACIARRMRKGHFPPPDAFVKACYVHDLLKLLKTSGLWTEFQQDLSSNTDLNLNWQTVKAWSEVKRYDPKATALPDAQEFIEAVEHSSNGVLTWIQSHW